MEGGDEEMAEAVYKKIKCPNCHDKELGPYRVDLDNVGKSHGNCNKCHQSYTVTHGKGSIKAVKGYA